MSKQNLDKTKAKTAEKLLESDNDIAIVGNCANCGVEYHIHTQSHIANLEVENKFLVEGLLHAGHEVVELQQEVKKLETQNKELREAIRHFIAKVDSGKARSTDSYNRFKQALKEDKQDG